MPLRPGEQPRQYGEFVGMEGCTQGRHPAHERLDAGRAGELERCKLHGDQRHRLIEVTDGATVIALVRALKLDRHARGLNRLVAQMRSSACASDNMMGAQSLD